MADPKYANLPGIAIDQPDIYETDDLPEVDQDAIYSEPEEETSAMIERPHISPENAFERFRGKFVDSSRVDFSDRITKHIRLGYEVHHGELNNEVETPQQKYLRLKCEFQELLDEVNSNGLPKVDGDKTKAQDVVKDVKEMQTQLQNLKLDSLNKDKMKDDLMQKQLLSKIEEIKSIDGGKDQKGIKKAMDSIQYELCFNPDKLNEKASQLSRVTELESRIQRLESVLGSNKKEKLSSIASHSSNQSVLGCLNIIHSKLSLLDPNQTQLDLIESRLASVLQKVTKISEKKFDVQELERTLKLSDLYDLMEESSSTINALPEISARLNSLKELHENAMEIVKEMAQIRSIQESIVKGTVDNENSLKILQSVLQDTIKKLSK